MKERSGHPSEGRLRAYLDGEVAPWHGIGIATHLRRCGACRRRLGRLRETGDRADRLLGIPSPAVDVPEAWTRFRVRSGASSGRRGRVPRGRMAAAVATLAALILAAGAVRFGTRSGSFPGADCDAVPVSGVAATAFQGVQRDVCCGDYDGGGLPDDGLFTLSRPDETVRWVVVYEDVDGSGTYTEGDVLRYRSPDPGGRPGRCEGERT